MCGRYDNLIAREAYRGLFRATRLPDWNFPLRYNTAPTYPVPIVRIDPRDGVRELAIARWGLIPSGGKEIPKVPHINARCETVATNGLFRNAFAKRRALVPATGFYEWKTEGKLKQPWRFTLSDESPFAFAGLWEFTRIDDRDIVSTTIVTTTPNSLIAPLHDRMPVILRPDDYDRWLSPETPAEHLAAVTVPYDADAMRGYKVSTLVNSVKNDVPACIEPVEE
jgi:putative SOS response-associated peptidase YedK